MRFVIRADASLKIGTGHSARCLTLATFLKEQGHEISLICRELEGHRFETIRQSGFELLALPPPDGKDDHRLSHSAWLETSSQTDAVQTIAELKKYGTKPDWIIVDHYALDSTWENELRPFVEKIMVIDDLADRTHNADLLLDQNLFENHKVRYAKLTPEHCRQLTGPGYALLRPSFSKARQDLKAKKDPPENFFIFVGGVDQTGETTKVLRAFEKLSLTNSKIAVVIGGTNPQRAKIQTILADFKNTKLHIDTPDMAQLMAASDFAIGAGGATTWERLCLGLPSLTLAIAQNQIETSKCVEALGLHIYGGWAPQLTFNDLAQLIAEAVADYPELLQSTEKAMKLVDGRGLWRVAEFLTST